MQQNIIRCSKSDMQDHDRRYQKRDDFFHVVVIQNQHTQVRKVQENDINKQKTLHDWSCGGRKHTTVRHLGHLLFSDHQLKTDPQYKPKHVFVLSIFNQNLHLSLTATMCFSSLNLTTSVSLCVQRDRAILKTETQTKSSKCFNKDHLLDTMYSEQPLLI